MKRNAFIGLLAIMLVFCLFSCKEDDDNDPDSGGTFTLTGIPIIYDGKYAMLFGWPSDSLQTSMIIGYNVNLSQSIASRIQISNGKVDIPLWISTINDIGATTKRYTGNHTINNVEIYIGGSAATASLPDDILIFFNSITFSNGNATKSWNEGIIFN